MLINSTELFPGDISGSDKSDAINSSKVWPPSMALSIKRDTLTQAGEGAGQVVKSSGAKVTLDGPTKSKSSPSTSKKYVRLIQTMLA